MTIFNSYVRNYQRVGSMNQLFFSQNPPCCHLPISPHPGSSSYVAHGQPRLQAMAVPAAVPSVSRTGAAWPTSCWTRRLVLRWTKTAAAVATGAVPVWQKKWVLMSLIWSYTFLVCGFNLAIWKMMEFVSWDDEIPNNYLWPWLRNLQ